MRQASLFLIAHLFCFCITKAQVTGGRAMFDFLNVPVNAHLAGLSGSNVSVFDRDPNMFLANPALLNKKMDKVFSYNYMPYIADIKAHAVAFAYDLGKAGPVGVSVKYLNYGNIDQRDQYGDYQGTFNSKEYVITISKSYTVGSMTVGGNVKWMSSQLASYTANAWAVDMGVLFKHPEKDLTIGLSVNNLGKVYKRYTGLSNDSLPFNILMGISYKPEMAPIRVSLTAHHLNRWDIVYNDPDKPTKVDDQGKPITKKTKNAERLMRHFNFALEILPAKFMTLWLGYNYLMSRELSLTDGISTAGISLGGKIKYEFIEAAYTHTIIHKAGGMNVLSLNLDLGKGYQMFAKQN
jgi:hypothetical protein